MIKHNFYNDAPIMTPEDDKFGIDRFAKSLSYSIKSIYSPIGVTIALNGPWGSGKSSAVNLIRHHLKIEVDKDIIEIIDFKCWWFRGEEALTLAFLQQMNASLKKTLNDKTKDIIPRISKLLLQAGPVVGPAVNLMTGGVWGALTTGSMDFTKKFFSESESVENLFSCLYKVLSEQGKRFLVIIDDIDRLAPNESLLIFRLIKSVGRLPNIMYLLVFDRALAEKTVSEAYPTEGPHFLEKIIQASFDLPLPARDDLNNAALLQIEHLCGEITGHDNVLRFMNIFYDAISPYIKTPRDLTRLSNSISVSWPAVVREVDVGHFIALEVLRLFEPTLYNTIRTSKNRLCGVRSIYNNNEDPNKEIEIFLSNITEKNRDICKTILLRLFPRLENVVYSNDFLDKWEEQRLLCSDKHFDTYFRMGIGDDTISIVDIENIIERAGDRIFIKELFHKSLNIIRKNGKSRVPLLFDEMNVHAAKIDQTKLIDFISAIFEVADDIDREEDSDRGGFSIGDTHLRIHWLIRKLTFNNRCNITERDRIFMTACKNAQIGWLVDFTDSAIRDYHPRKGNKVEVPEKCLIALESIPILRTHALGVIKSAAITGKLIIHRHLPSILFRWMEFAEDDGSDVKAWTREMLTSDDSASMLAKAFTGESWSQGLGGLGDRVSMRKVRASVDGIEKIIDVVEFRHRLEEIEKNNDINEAIKNNVTVFLKAWKQKEDYE